MPIVGNCPVIKKSFLVTQVRKETHRLQNVSSEAEKTGKAGGGASGGAVGGTGEGSWLGGHWGDGADSDGGWDNGGWDAGGWDNWDNGSWGGWDSWDGGVDVDWGRWLNDNWLGDGAWAVGDGQGGGLSDGVGNAVEAQGGGLWAVGGEGSVDLSDPGDVAVGSDGGHKGGGNGGDGELHLDDWNYLLKSKEVESLRLSLEVEDEF